MKYIITESQYNRAIDIFMNYQFEPHEVKTSSNFPNSIFWVKNGEVVAEIADSKFFWVHEDKWNTFSKMFSLQYHDVEQYMKRWLDEHYNLGKLIIMPYGYMFDVRWKSILDWDN